MITKWTVSNFKSFRDETELEFGPLTIFAGPNSSGKSTIIQSVLLIAQTLAHKVGSRSVILNGTLVSLGQFDDLKSNGGTSDQITIKCTCERRQGKNAAIGRRARFGPLRPFQFKHRPDQPREVTCTVSFGANGSGAQPDLFQIQPQLFSSRLSCNSGNQNNEVQQADISIRHPNKPFPKIEGADSTRETDDRLTASLAYDIELDNVSMSELKSENRSAEPIGCMLRHFLPERVVCSVDPILEDAITITDALKNFNHPTPATGRDMSRHIVLSKEIIDVLRNVLDGMIDFDQTIDGAFRRERRLRSNSDRLSLWSLCRHFRDLSPGECLKVEETLCELGDLFDRIHAAVRASAEKTPEKEPVVALLPPSLIDAAAWYLDDFFTSSLKYLGPLRDAPKPLYPLSPAVDTHDIGLRGEHTASILELHKKQKVRYVPSANFKGSEVDRRKITRSLEAAVKDWLQYLGVADSVSSRDQGKLGHELKVRLTESDDPHDLTHVGVGVSQVLPILVMGLLADTDSTLVFEQPELHLHPKVQTLLADFFLSMALSDKQCVVETHSEYLIDRLRFRIAAAKPEQELNSQAKVYFVEKPSQHSTFREVVINEFGAIPDWPDGFFDQSQQQAEEILRAAAMKRKASRRNNNT